MVREIGRFEKSSVREIGGKITEKYHPREREIGSRNQDSTVVSNVWRLSFRVNYFEVLFLLKFIAYNPPQPSSIEAIPDLFLHGLLSPLWHCSTFSIISVHCKKNRIARRFHATFSVAQ